MELILKNVHKSYGDKEVLKGIDFEFKKGNIYGLLGRNGAGKTTLFNCLSNETPFDSGSSILMIEGKEYTLNYEHIGYVFSTPILPEFLTGYEFIKFYIDINKKKIKEIKSISEYFEIVKIEEDDRHRLIKNYSVFL